MFDVDRAGGTYTLVAINGGIQDYEVNDILEIPGESLGGITGTNDAQPVNTVDTGEILTATISGIYAGNGTFTETGTYNPVMVVAIWDDRLLIMYSITGQFTYSIQHYTNSWSKYRCYFELYSYKRKL